MTFPCASTLERCAVFPASSRRDSAEASCARSTSASSSMRIWPSFAICPDSNLILVTVPGTSLLTATLRRPEMLPTAEIVALPGLGLRHRRADRLGRRPGLLHFLAHRHQLADLGDLDSRQDSDEDQQSDSHQQIAFHSSGLLHGAKSKPDRLSCHPLREGAVSDGPPCFRDVTTRAAWRAPRGWRAAPGAGTTGRGPGPDCARPDRGSGSRSSRSTIRPARRRRSGPPAPG